MEWFRSWFNSPYYHILYQNRDHREAAHFLDLVTDCLQLKPEARILDLGCGKGRHSIYLASKGFFVTGIDIAPENIKAASKHENENLEFYIHDFRHPFRKNYYDLTMNLFSSFGYFKTHKEEMQVIKNAAASLKDKGCFLIDYMNAGKVAANLVREEVKEVGDINFTINRYIENGRIIKDIKVSDSGTHEHYQETLKVISLEEFTEWFTEAGLTLKNVYGDYNLQKYDPVHSSRIILIGQKA